MCEMSRGAPGDRPAEASVTPSRFLRDKRMERRRSWTDLSLDYSFHPPPLADFFIKSRIKEARLSEGV